MGAGDRQPLPGTPVTARINQVCPNRLGAVYSSLHSFWLSRHNALNTGSSRRDAYTVILFDSYTRIAISNDFASDPDALLTMMLGHRAGGGTNFNSALVAAEGAMRQHWSTERYPFYTLLSAL